MEKHTTSAVKMRERGLPCHTCGRPMHRVYTEAGVGEFCSPRCRDKSLKPGWQRWKP